MQSSQYVAIVDDDTSHRRALARLLAAHGVEARCYHSARAFLNALSSDMPDCLIVDVHMPEMTGLDLQRELLRRGIDLPTIVVTASDDDRIAADAAALGALAFLRKPVTKDALMAAVTVAVTRRT